MLGGEEFVLVLPETDVDEAAALAEKLRMLVMREPIDIEQAEPVSVTISAGVAGGIGQLMRVEDLVRHADTAMLSAKGLGRNQVFVFAEPNEESRVPRAPISAEGRASALEIGRAARTAAEQMIQSVIEPLPHYRGKPSELIAVIATTMAGHLALPQAEIDRIRVASLLHDVGKVAIPEAILDKPAPLTGAEWQSVIQHPRIGQLFLEQAGSLCDAVPIILHTTSGSEAAATPTGGGARHPAGRPDRGRRRCLRRDVHDRPYRPPSAMSPRSTSSVDTQDSSSTLPSWSSSATCSPAACAVSTMTASTSGAPTTWAALDRRVAAARRAATDPAAGWEPRPAERGVELRRRRRWEGALDPSSRVPWGRSADPFAEVPPAHRPGRPRQTEQFRRSGLGVGTLA